MNGNSGTGGISQPLAEDVAQLDEVVGKAGQRTLEQTEVLPRFRRMRNFSSFPNSE